MHKLFLIFTLICIISGCGGVGKYRDDLTPVKADSYFILENNLEYEFKIENAFGGEVERKVKLKKGIYRAFSENENGTYYSPEEKDDYNFLNIIKIGDNDPIGGFYIGGVWITKENPPTAAPYYILGKMKPLKVGIKFFKNSIDNSNPNQVEIINNQITDKISHDIVENNPNLGILDAAVASAVVNMLATMDNGKPVLELQMPQDIFKSNILVVKGSKK